MSAVEIDVNHTTEDISVKVTGDSMGCWARLEEILNECRREAPDILNEILVKFYQDWYRELR